MGGSSDPQDSTNHFTASNLSRHLSSCYVSVRNMTARLGLPGARLLGGLRMQLEGGSGGDACAPAEALKPPTGSRRRAKDPPR